MTDAPSASAPAEETSTSDEETVSASEAVPAEEAEAPKYPVVITGTTSGIGYWTARDTAARGWPVVLHCRDRERGEAVRTELAELEPDVPVDLVVGDLSVQADVRRVAREILDKHEQLSALVNNAGVRLGERIETADGLETMLAVNHVAPFMLTELLRPALVAGKGRVVSMSSFMHKRGRLNLDDLQSTENFSGTRCYSTTKLANLLVTYAWSRRLVEDGVMINAYNPGLVRTKMLGSGITAFLAPILAKSPKVAATTASFLAVSPRITHVNGKYYAATGSAKRSSAVTYDEELQEKVWVATRALYAAT